MNAMGWFLGKQDQLEGKILEWKEVAGDKLKVDWLVSYSGHKVYALTLSDFGVSTEEKRAHYFAQPHAHEPGATAGMMDILEQLVTGEDLWGESTSLEVQKVLRESLLTFNPIGNPEGRERAPVVCWDGTTYTNNELWCWMRGEDPDKPGKMWERYDLWDDREVKAPDPVGIVYEQIDEHRYVEPNRSQLSSYFKLFHLLDSNYHYDRWLDLHQTEFVNSPFNCEILLGIEGLASGEILQEDKAWGQLICDAWKKAGYSPKPEPIHLGYGGKQAEYFQKNWGPLHQRMAILNTEVKNNAADAPPDFQVKAQSIAIQVSIERLVEGA